MPFWALTPDVRSTLTLYNRCAERKALPCPGGVLDQPEELMSDFDVIDQVLMEERKRQDLERRERVERAKSHG